MEVFCRPAWSNVKAGKYAAMLPLAAMDPLLDSQQVPRSYLLQQFQATSASLVKMVASPPAEEQETQLADGQSCTFMRLYAGLHPDRLKSRRS